jgi:hypothetical protein
MSGRTSSFHYDAKKHNNTIHPHHDEGVTVKSCDKNTVVLHVSGVAVDKAKAWVPGWLFTATQELGCPHPVTGAPSVAYRRVTGVTRETGGKITLATERAEFHDFFDKLKMRMFTNMILHNNSDPNDSSNDDAAADAAANAAKSPQPSSGTSKDAAGSTAKPSSGTSTGVDAKSSAAAPDLGKRRLLVRREGREVRKLGFLKKWGKHIKKFVKKVVKGVGKVIKKVGKAVSHTDEMQKNFVCKM